MDRVLVSMDRHAHSKQYIAHAVMAMDRGRRKRVRFTLEVN